MTSSLAERVDLRVCAYNSLSIEGYRVSAELIERVRSDNWNPDSLKGDQDHRDALAARGYWQSFQTAKRSPALVMPATTLGPNNSLYHVA